MKLRKNNFVVSFIILALCMMLTVGATYSLYVDSIVLPTEIGTGQMDITLKRSLLTAMVLDDEGYLAEYQNAEEIDFSNETTEQIFDIETTDKIVPGCNYEAGITISNASDVAYKYWIEVEIISELSEELASHLSLAYFESTQEAPIEKYFDEAAETKKFSLGSKAVPLGTLAKNGSRVFSLTFEFSAADGNTFNALETIKFNITVMAEQVTTRT